MKIKKIRIPYDLESVDVENDNIDVFVDTDDGFTYTISIATVENVRFLMEKDGMNYEGPGYPSIIVKKLTTEIIEEAITAFAEEDDGYWLKVYHFAGWIRAIPESMFDQLKTKQKKATSLEFDELEELDEFENS